MEINLLRTLSFRPVKDQHNNAALLGEIEELNFNGIIIKNIIINICQTKSNIFS